MVGGVASGVVVVVNGGLTKTKRGWVTVKDLMQRGILLMWWESGGIYYIVYKFTEKKLVAYYLSFHSNIAFFCDRVVVGLWCQKWGNCRLCERFFTKWLKNS